MTIESPAEPLPKRDLNARVVTRDFAITYASEIAIQSNRIMATSDSDAARLNALRWKIDSTSKVLVAATNMSPMMALLDTWALTAQVDDFLRSMGTPFTTGAPGTTIADTAVTGTTARLRERIQLLARRVLTAREFERVRALVDRHAREYPLTSIAGARVPVSGHPSIEDYDDLLALTTVGTAAEAMGDVADRMRLYSLALQYSTRWQVELLAMETGIGSDDVVATLRRFDSHLAEMARFASASPYIAQRATADLESALSAGTADVRESTLLIMDALQAEREALFDELDGQWRFLAAELDSQRKATTEDLERVAGDLTDEFWANVDMLTGKLIVFLFLSMALILIVPFSAGYLVGRARGSG